MPPFQPEHLTIDAPALHSEQPGGRFVFLPGSPTRARAIAEHFEDRRGFPSPRGHEVFTGHLCRGDQRLEVATVSTGMGCPSVDIIVSELLGLGARRLLRVGTAGSLQPARVKAGDLVIATGAVRDEGTSIHYAPLEFPALAAWQLVQAAQRAAATRSDLGSVHVGVVHTKDSLYARELGAGPRAEDHRRYRAQLSALGVLASEMEAAHLFVLAQSHAGPQGDEVWAGCILGVVGDEVAFGDKTQRTRTEAAAIALSLETAWLAQSKSR
ncbi:MAG: uridine phosphorylase [Proteobacteria bacterium]|nr:uridine phosphorylase [Pseudomonadota bacterium]